MQSWVRMHTRVLMNWRREAARAEILDLDCGVAGKMTPDYPRTPKTGVSHAIKRG
jgi:hypothetical protein